MNPIPIRRPIFMPTVLAPLALVFALALLAPGPAAAQNLLAGAVYTMTNAAAGNSVVAFRRGSDGTLEPAGAFSTGGQGTGAGLGSQGALILSPDSQWLFAVNAGSNSLSSFAVRRRSDLFRLHRRLRLALAASHFAPHMIGHTAGGDLNQPSARILGKAVLRPLDCCRNQRFLDCIFGRGKVAKTTYGRAEHLRHKLAHQMLNGIGHVRRHRNS